MHLPATALPGARELYLDPAAQAIASQVFGARSSWFHPGSAVNVLLGDLVLANAGNGIKIKEGTNAKMGAATLVAGTVTVNTTAVAANSRVMLSGQNSSGTHGELTVSARVAGTSFTISSSNAADTRSIAWLILDPAP